MMQSFFALAMVAPNRQRAFRLAIVMHCLLAAALSLTVLQNAEFMPGAGLGFLIAGVVEGAMFFGWRLTQLPKSQALEFLLVSPLQPQRLFLAEAAVGLTRLGLVTLAGLPALTIMVLFGRAELVDVLVLLIVPWLWGAVVGLGLTCFAYEPRRVRRIGETLGLAVILCYLIVGVLAGEKLPMWLAGLPADLRWWLIEIVVRMHQWNPFAVMQYWFGAGREPHTAIARLVGVQITAALTLIAISIRAAWRLKGHFHDRHYRPLCEVTPADPSGIRDRPLVWWAVRRVMEYSGRTNIYLAAGFGIVYAAFLVAGDAWPMWFGRGVFEIIERAGGVATLTTGLVLLATVPAAFQYGLWDSSGQQRLRRLELLLLTRLDGRDYWDAAAAAAWRRGRGYFAVAVLLWLAAGYSGRYPLAHVVAAIAAAGLLWAGYFALGFRAFSSGMQANGLGSLLTLGLPLLSLVLIRCGCPALAAWTPPGMVYAALTGAAGGAWLGAAMALGTFALWSARTSMAGCDASLRSWYDRHHGLKMVD